MKPPAELLVAGRESPEREAETVCERLCAVVRARVTVPLSMLGGERTNVWAWAGLYMFTCLGVCSHRCVCLDWSTVRPPVSVCV